MYIFQSWSESLRLFLPKNLKLFILVTFRAYYLTLKDVYTHLVGILSGIGLLLIGLDVLQVFSMSDSSWYIGHFVVLTRLLLVFVLVLAVRPSIAVKNRAYYKNYWWYSIYIYLLFVLTVLASYLLYAGIPHYYLWGFYFLTLGGTLESSLVIPTMIISPLLICIILFIFDSKGSFFAVIQAIAQGALMFIYNYPFCLITFIFLHEYARLVTYIYGKSVALLASFSIQSLFALIAIISVHQCIFISISVIGGLLPLIWITNFYIKRVHEQYALYDT